MFGLATESNEKRLTKELFAGIDIEEGRDLKEGDVLKAILGHNRCMDFKRFCKKCGKLLVGAAIVMSASLTSLCAGCAIGGMPDIPSREVPQSSLPRGQIMVFLSASDTGSMVT